MSPTDSVDLSGRTAVVTGATSGIGEAAAAAFARMGARTILLARSPSKAEASRAKIARASGTSADALEVVLADLSAQKEVRRAAAEIGAATERIDILFNNAAVAQLALEETVDGIETTWAVNHLAYFLLTTLLLERLDAAPAARIVNVASDAHKFGGPLDFDDLESRNDFGFRTSYGRSKLANLLFTKELARRLSERGSATTVNAYHPGMVRTGLGAQNGWIGRIALSLVAPFARTPEKGAHTGVLLATSPRFEGASGGYYADERPNSIANGGDDPELARRLWEASERMTEATA